MDNIFGTNRDDIAININITRIIFKCKNKECKHIRAFDYRKVYRVYPETIYPRNTYLKPYRVEAVFKYVRMTEDNKTVYHEDDYTCDCGRRADSNLVVGKYSDHKCDARCMGATGGVCECTCGGKNHGVNHL